MNILKSLRWRLRTWLNKKYWSKPIATVPRPVKSKIIVGLTTSPQRIVYLKPVLKSILRQSCPPDEIHLNIPHIFKRDGSSYDIPNFINEIDPRIKIVRVEDIGPGTKIIPTLLQLNEASDTIVITADDDILMLPQTIETLTAALKIDSSAVYGLSGYRLGLDLIPIYTNKRIPVDVLEGYAHFAVHRKLISNDFISYLKIAHSLRAGYLHDDIILANYFAHKKINRIQLYDNLANRKIIRNRGAQLHYGIGLDALHKGGGDLISDNVAKQTQQARDICTFMKRQKLWALPH